MPEMNKSKHNMPHKIGIDIDVHKSDYLLPFSVNLPLKTVTLLLNLINKKLYTPSITLPITHIDGIAHFNNSISISLNIFMYRLENRHLIFYQSSNSRNLRADFRQQNKKRKSMTSIKHMSCEQRP